MSAVLLTIAPVHPEVIVGESLNVKVTLENTGTEPVEVHSPESPSELEFILRTEEQGREPRMLSEREAMSLRNPESVPELPTTMATLAPKATLDYTEDLAGLAIPPLEAGRYQVSVAYRLAGERVESPGEPISIVVPQVRALAAAPGPTRGNLSLVFVHAAADKTQAVFHHESAPGAPADGTAYRRATVAPPASVTAAATTVELYRNQGVRWVAWLQDGALAAAVAQLHTLFVSVKPVDLGLKSPELQPVGWQTSDNTAVFAALGTGEGNRVAMAIVSFDARDGGKGRVTTVPLAAAARPTWWAAQYQVENEKARLHVVCAAVAEGKMQVQRQTVSLDTGEAEAPVLLTERAEMVAALALSPLAGEPAAVDALFGPVGDEGKLTLLRLPLDGGKPLGEWTSTAPEGPDKARPSAWAMALALLPDPVVLAKHGNKLLARRAAGGDWAPLADQAARAVHLQLAVLADGVVWAVWADPRTGIHFRALR